ncbi:bactericidal permeability-increasing protein-like [Oscarella lobularis]|uniref:bactericidal permeability-increasing protein-like n=1 Tax=Oscarella lobularis TaxID=121494 RepID=UPI00331315FE
MLFRLFLSLLVSHGVVSVNPGFRIELSEKGLDYVRQVAMPILVKQLQNLAIPDQSGSAGTPVGSIDYSLSDIKLTEFSIPSSSLTIVANTGVQVGASGVSVHLSGHWHYREHSWPHISDSGSCDVSASSISLSTVVGVGADSSGRPTISANSCSFNIGKLDIDFHGGASWLYNLFSGTIADGLKGSIEGSVCSAAKDAINTQGNKALATLPVEEKLTSNSEINFELIQAPIFTSSYLETLHKGEFLYIPHPSTEIPFEPSPLPTAAASNSMMTIWITDYIVNTAGYVYQEAGVLQINITQSMLPSGIPISLNTTSFKPLIPELYAKYPNEAMQLFLTSTSAPYINITSGFINVTAPGRLVAYVRVNETTLVNAFTLGLTMHATGHASLRRNGSQEMVIGNATYLRSDISVVASNVGHFEATSLEAAVNLLYQIGVIPLINKYGAAGFAIPSVDGVTFVNPVVAQGEGYIQISTDINYNPSSLFSEELISLHRDKVDQLANEGGIV